MRLTSLAATDFLSFAQLDLDVSRGLSVIVGPNGSGKTNLGRIVRLAVSAVRAAAAGDVGALDQEWALSGRYGRPGFEVRIGLHFDEQNEIAVIEDWTRAAILNAFDLSDDRVVARLDDLLRASPLGAGVLTSGTLVIRRDDRRTFPWAMFWQAVNRDAHLDLWNHAFAPGPPTDGTGPVQRWKTMADVIEEAAGPGSATLARTGWPGWEKFHQDTLAAFTLADAIRAGSRVALVARRTTNDPEIVCLRRLTTEFPVLQETNSRSLTFATVLDRLMSSALVVTENRRVPVTTSVEPTRITTRSELADGSGLAVELLRRKNGDATDRQRFTAAQRVFRDLTGRLLEVRQQASGSESGELLVTPVVVDADPDSMSEVDLPLRLAGVGVEESAWLAALLTGEHRTLVLDEPASNMSAVAQRRLLRVIREQRSDRQTVMITHSADLVPIQDASDLTVVTRLSRDRSGTRVHRPRIDQFGFEELKELLRHSQLRALLFAAGVVLVEGPTEVDAFETWLARSDESTPESSHVVFLSVGGDERFAKHAQLMELLGVPYTIVADGPAFVPDKALSKLPSPAPAPVGAEPESFEEAVARWAPHRVRTLATEFGTGDRKGRGEIEAFFETVDAALWDELNRAAGRKDKPLLGYRFAARTPVPERVVELWRLLRQDLGLLPSASGGAPGAVID